MVQELVPVLIAAIVIVAILAWRQRLRGRMETWVSLTAIAVPFEIAASTVYAWFQLHSAAERSPTLPIDARAADLANAVTRASIAWAIAGAAAVAVFVILALATTRAKRATLSP